MPGARAIAPQRQRYDPDSGGESRRFEQMREQAHDFFSRMIFSACLRSARVKLPDSMSWAITG